MFSLILLVAAIWLAVYLILTFIPMTAPGPMIVKLVAGICTLFLLLRAFGLLDHDIPVPKL